MKKLFIAAFLLFGCNSSEDLEGAKNEVANKVPGILRKMSGGGILLEECKIYEFDRITGKEALDFRIRALSDSVIIHKRLLDFYNKNIEQRRLDMKGLDSVHRSTEEVKKIIDRYISKIDSNNLAAVVTQKKLDSLTAIKNTGSDKKDFYKAMFRVCYFNITSASSCDSFAFLFDKERNFISMHENNKQ
jgi:hypothetical protein